MSTATNAPGRSPPSDGHPQATLSFGDKEITVRLVDESPGGFAVTCSERVPIAANQRCRLRTNQGWCEVRVSRTEVFLNGMLLGLLRLREDSPKERWLRFLTWWTRWLSPAKAQGRL